MRPKVIAKRESCDNIVGGRQEPFIKELVVSEKRKRRENIITALLIAGMCIVIGGTIIFIIKFNKPADEAILLAPGMTEASGFSTGLSDENTTALDSFPEINTPGASLTSAASESVTPSVSPKPTAEPTPTEEPTPVPTPEPTEEPPVTTPEPIEPPPDYFPPETPVGEGEGTEVN